ncbi:MAG: Putative deoxyribonuclease YjjV [uncultured Thiotrichaceae bacterium]|uniref:Deoxyribonuclease YjjV n=1 Tax=uncultured Thiotrichaceae bacterium TaxID=298394 RepID=A0A6S6TSZ6_9GAMM|nr:MAG: Putative deoxyribonuclease YjjV [uncultured Thiotrichaceae bacterium]
MTLFDTHCHLDFKVFESDRSKVIERAKKQGVQDILVPSVSYKNWQAVLDLQEEFAGIHVALGMHPMFLEQHRAEDIKALDFMLEHNVCKAVGECGIDLFVKGLAQHKQRQVDIFIEHLRLAKKYDLPVIIHARKSLDIVLKYIRQFTGLRGIMHSFSGSRQQAEICIEQGFLLGFGGPVTYPRARKLRELVRTLPLESLLLETDAPDQVDESRYGERNEPAFLPAIMNTFAELREISPTEVADVTTQNAKALLRLNS